MTDNAKKTTVAAPVAALTLHEEGMGLGWRKPTDTMTVRSVNVSKVGNIDIALFQSQKDTSKVSGRIEIHVGGITEDAAKKFADFLVDYLASATGSDIGPSTYRKTAKKPDEKPAGIAGITE